MAGVQCVGLALAVRQGDARLYRLGYRAAILGFALLLVGFAVLMAGFITSDFSLVLVAQHSHILKPMLYKISGVWGNHEGSLMLWVVMLGLFACLLAWRLAAGMNSNNKIRRNTLALALSSQGGISLAFLLLILLASNPFARFADPPISGAGLNPVLQDPGLALHPPMLYLGYVGLSAGFAFAIAALIQRRADSAWAAATRPWVLLAWATLTAGIALGSRWAYYELGWGGWWFWDPVENASLMPWLIATALLHSLLVVEKRGLFRAWAVLLAILGFGMSLLGTFIVRSGLLTSVHAFTNDPTRGLIILFIIVVMLGVPLVLFALRAPYLAGNASIRQPALISRDTALQINNLLLVVAAASVLIGTFYPLMLDALFGVRISVGPPFFETSLAPLLALMLLVMGIAPLLAWQKGRLKSRVLLGMVLAAVTVAVLVLLLTEAAPLPALAAIGLAVWVMAGLVAVIKRGLGNSGNLGGIGMGQWAMVVSHFGVAIFALGVAGTNFFSQETIVRLQIGESATLGEARYVLLDVAETEGVNYFATSAFVDRIVAGGSTRLISEIRRYPIAGSQTQTTTEAAIASHLLGDAYVVFGGGSREAGGFVLRIHHKPMVAWLWGGAGFMAGGGGLALLGVAKNPRRGQ